MKRVVTSEEPLNFGESLNYVPYRKRQQYYSPKYSICSKRSSFSFRSPNPFHKAKYEHKNNHQNTVHFQQKQTNSPTIVQQTYDSVIENTEPEKAHTIQKQQKIGEHIGIQFPDGEQKTNNETILDHNTKNEETSQTNSVLEQYKIIENCNSHQSEHYQQDSNQNEDKNESDNENQVEKNQQPKIIAEKQLKQQKSHFSNKQGTTKMKGKKSLVDRFSIKSPTRKQLNVNLLTKFGSNKKLSKPSIPKNNPETPKKSQTSSIMQISKQQKQTKEKQIDKNEQKFAQIMKTLKTNSNKMSSKLPHKNDDAGNAKSSKLLMRFKKKET